MNSELIQSINVALQVFVILTIRINRDSTFIDLIRKPGLDGPLTESCVNDFLYIQHMLGFPIIVVDEVMSSIDEVTTLRRAD